MLFRSRIEVGNGMEGVLTDAQASRITRNVMAPKFRQNDFVGGIESAVTRVIDLSEERDSDESSEEDAMYLFGVSVFIIVIIIIVMWLRGKRQRSSGHYRSSSGGSSSIESRDDSDNSSSSSSGSGFGGGGFSGGGASDSW